MTKLTITFNRDRRGEIRSFIEACETCGLYPWRLDRLCTEYNEQTANEQREVSIFWIADTEDLQVNRWLAYMLLRGYPIVQERPWWL